MKVMNKIFAVLLLVTAFAFAPPTAAPAAGATNIPLDISVGPITITFTSGTNYTIAGGGYTGTPPSPTTADTVTITGSSTANTITVDGGGNTPYNNTLNVTLNSVDITSSTASPFALTNSADVKLTLSGNNNILTADSSSNSAGLQVTAGNKITITANNTTQTLTATGSGGGAGIGGGDWSDSGAITIGGGTVTAYGSYNGAGIGGGRHGGGGTIAINGGTVIANGGDHGAGIGGGEVGGGGDITIGDGIVTATGGDYGAGIGGGDVSILGGTINIDVGAITIAGGTVTATGGLHGAGIGCGYVSINSNSSGTINIDGGTIAIGGGTVTANGGSNAAGIGGGYVNIEASTITISRGGTINIYGSATVIAKGNGGSRDIGKGANYSYSGSDPGNITNITISSNHTVYPVNGKVDPPPTKTLGGPNVYPLYASQDYEYEYEREPVQVADKTISGGGVPSTKALTLSQITMIEGWLGAGNAAAAVLWAEEKNNYTNIELNSTPIMLFSADVADAIISFDVAIATTKNILLFDKIKPTPPPPPGPGPSPDPGPGPGPDPDPDPDPGPDPGPNPPSSTVAAPTASLTGGTYDKEQIVTLSTETEGATIWYTTDGSDPLASGTEYIDGEPITVAESMTLRAIAVKDGINSAEMTVEYIINAAPGPSPDPDPDPGPAPGPGGSDGGGCGDAWWLGLLGVLAAGAAIAEPRKNG